MTDQINSYRSIASRIGTDELAPDWLGFGVGAEYQPSRVAEWLALGTEDLARLADAPHGDAAAVPVREHLIEVAAMCNLVAEIIDGDIEKAKAWFKAVNPLLGDVTPCDMIRLGRFERLRKFIGSSLRTRACAAPSTHWHRIFHHRNLLARKCRSLLTLAQIVRQLRALAQNRLQQWHKLSVDSA